MSRKWSPADRFAFSTQRLRAQTVPDKKKASNKAACRKFRENDDYT